MSGLKVSAIRVTVQKGRASAMQTAVEKPITPAPTTTTLMLFILDGARAGGEEDLLVLDGCRMDSAVSVW